MSRQLDVTVITGMSGAGRSAAGDVLEDLGYFVIDNLPPALMSNVRELARGQEELVKLALVVDVRSGEFVADLEDALSKLRVRGAETRVLFLDASDEVLVRRYDATRRKHPLGSEDRVSEGIAQERRLLEELKGQADVVVDTSDLNVHELRDRLWALFADPPDRDQLQTSVVSFGYKHGLPVDVDLVFDCRFLPNPHWVPDLRPLAGTAPEVREYVLASPVAREFLDELERMLNVLLPAYVQERKMYLSIGIGCTGGRHRSVVIATEVADMLQGMGVASAIHHRDIDRD
ncbi:MAG TPA: RNase adapter RapZ [Acidimicrobiia bacterium]